MADESAATLASRMRCRTPRASACDLLARLIGGIAVGLPPAAVGHVKGIAEGDDGLWAGSAPIPPASRVVVPRRLQARAAAPDVHEAGYSRAAGFVNGSRARGEVLLEIVQVAVGCDIGDLERSLARAVDGMQTELGVELVRE